VPRRTNTFQQVLALVFWLLAKEGEVVAESEELPDTDTGEMREVDVLVTGRVGGLPITVQIETTTRKRPADVKWVEMEVGLHESVQTDKLILVSESGFTKRAREKAEATGAIPIQPGDFDSDDAVGDVVNRLASIFPKILNMKPEQIAGVAEKSDGEMVNITELSLQTMIFLETGDEIGTIGTEIRRRMDANFLQTAEEIGLPDIAGDVDAKFNMAMPNWVATVDGKEFHACVKWDEVEPPEFHRIKEIQVRGFAEIRVAEIHLTHKKLGEIAMAYGTGRLGDDEVLVVVTEGEGGKKIAMNPLPTGTPDTRSTEGRGRFAGTS
jgi:hypothetical protein